MNEKQQGNVQATGSKELFEALSSREKMFTKEWWKQRFDNGKSLGFGAVELKNEDKFWWVGILLYRQINKIFVAIEEKFGQDGVAVLSEVLLNDFEEVGKFLLEVLGIEERDAVTLAALVLTNDANWGHSVAMKEAANDRSSASTLCGWCGFAACGAAIPEVCEKYAVPMVFGLMKAIDPSGENITGHGVVGPPCIGHFYGRA